MSAAVGHPSRTRTTSRLAVVTSATGIRSPSFLIRRIVVRPTRATPKQRSPPEHRCCRVTGPKRNKQIERIEQHTVRRTVRCMQRSIWTPRKPSHNDTVPAPNSTLQPIRYPAIGASSAVVWVDGRAGQRPMVCWFERWCVDAAEWPRRVRRCASGCASPQLCAHRLPHCRRGWVPDRVWRLCRRAPAVTAIVAGRVVGSRAASVE